MSYELNVKPTFLHQLAALQAKYTAQILQKVELLCTDPTPAEPLKKQLHGVKGKLYRLRSGDYRILYTFGAGWVSLIGVDNRKDVYKHLPSGALLPTTPAADVADVEDIEPPDEEEQPDDDVSVVSVNQGRDDPSAERAGPVIGSPPVRHSVLTLEHEPATSEDDRLPTQPDLRLLKRLDVPTSFHRALLDCHTLGDLYRADVPESIRDKVFDCVARQDYQRVLEQQPDLIAHNVDALRRYVKGELSGLLLSLSPEQRKFVEWGMHSAHPVLLKEAPGSGKTTIALYRAARVAETLQREGVLQPRILVTTYTKALTTAAEQLLNAIAGTYRACITVQTADSVVYQLLKDHGELGALSVASSVASAHREKIEREVLREAREQVRHRPPAKTQTGARQGIQHLSDRYVLEVLLDVIEARQLSEWELYETAKRTGRRVALTKAQRRIIWTIHGHFTRLLADAGYETWQQRRARAAELAKRVRRTARYDAVIIDEAQDLNTSVMRMLVRLCAYKSRLFVTADACQAIYNTGFLWSDLQNEVGLRGSVRMLSRNYRSTRQIGEAAWAYLGADALEAEDRHRYTRRGEKPQLLYTATQEEEGRTLAKLLPREAARQHLGLGSCAVLCASRQAAKRLATQLSEQGVPAYFMERDELYLERSGVKVMTLHSAKGLEFPVVAVAGFFESRMAKPPRTDEAAAEAEWLARSRRTVFVGMTRAMRALIVALPQDTDAPALVGFDPQYWRVRQVRGKQRAGSAKRLAATQLQGERAGSIKRRHA